MPGKIILQNLTEDEIRYLLARRLHSKSQERLECYRRTGRAIVLVKDDDPSAVGQFYSAPISEKEETFPGKNGLDKQHGARLLFIVELVLVVGLFATVGYSLSRIKTLNWQSAQVLTLPTLTPTPLINAVVIPSGHTPPTSPGGDTRPNDAEIPAHLLPLLQAQFSLPTPTPAVEQGIRIHIPALDVDAPIVQGDGWEELKKGVAQHIGSANPGEKGNIVLTGHNDVFGEIFRYLDRLKAGDEIHIYTARRAYTYTVSGWKLVKPTQVEVMGQTPDATLTLISCYPYLIDNQRIIVTGRLSSQGI